MTMKAAKDWVSLYKEAQKAGMLTEDTIMYIADNTSDDRLFGLKTYPREYMAGLVSWVEARLKTAKVDA